MSSEATTTDARRPEVRDGTYEYLIADAGIAARDSGSWFRIGGTLAIDGTKHVFPVTLCIQSALNMR